MEKLFTSFPIQNKKVSKNGSNLGHSPIFVCRKVFLLDKDFKTFGFPPKKNKAKIRIENSFDLNY